MSDCILAIETSTPRGHVAVIRHGEVLFEKTFTSQRSHNSQLFAPLGEALEHCGEALKFVVVGTGPGSYTGARIGIAAAQGIAFSRGVSVIGLPSALAPEIDVLPAEFVLCGDARRGQFYATKISKNHLPKEIELVDAETFQQIHAASDGLEWMTFDEKSPLGLADVLLVKPSAVKLAELAAGLSEENVKALAETLLEPVYLSAPFITMPKGKPGPPIS